jgi:beta-N-acetylhexosaminidase
VAASLQPVPAAAEESVSVELASPVIAFDPVILYAEGALAEMNLEERVRSLLVLHVPGTDPVALQSFMVFHRPGGFILMGNNVPETPGELAQVSTSLNLDPELPPLVAIDEEGGFVTRLPYDQFAGANTLRFEAPEATLAAFTGRAALLKTVGVNVNFGIVADVTGDPASFIYDRTFGDTPEQAAPRVLAAVEGEAGVVASTLKHFPGHGSSTGDSHVSIPETSMTLDRWRATDALPFEAGIAAGAPLVMFGHLAYGAVDVEPASLSLAWHELLRSELGFTGLTITDDMTMLQGSGLPEFADPVENAIRAMAAGNDLLLYVLAADPSIDGVDPEAIVTGLLQAIQDGRIDEKAVDDAALRALILRRSFAPGAQSWFPPCASPCRALITAVSEG